MGKTPCQWMGLARARVVVFKLVRGETGLLGDPRQPLGDVVLVFEMIMSKVRVPLGR